MRSEVGIDSKVKLRPHPECVRVARQFVRSAHNRWPHAAEADVVVLLTSELVTNVVQHAGPHEPERHVLLRLRKHDSKIRVDIEDTSTRSQSAATER